MLIACPECECDVPAPIFRRGSGRVRVQCRVCGSMLAINRPPEINQEYDSADFLGKSLNLRGYEILCVLGRGGMGVVYGAVRLSDHSLVAVKVLPPECLKYPELIQRFDFEAQLMASLSHPNIVPILDRGRWENHPYIVLDYVPSITLKDRIEIDAPLGVDEILAISSPVAEALQACHDSGLVHRDLKPGNVLLSQDGSIKVTDFGIANLIQLLGDQTDHGVTIGTPQYVAPEQMRDGSSVDVRADQYSLAVLIYEMMTNDLPTGVFEPPSERYPDLTREAEGVLFKALARKPEARYESIRHFMRAFRRALKRPPDTPLPQNIIRAAAQRQRPRESGIVPFEDAVPKVVVLTEQEDADFVDDPPERDEDTFDTPFGFGTGDLADEKPHPEEEPQESPNGDVLVAPAAREEASDPTPIEPSDEAPAPATGINPSILGGIAILALAVLIALVLLIIF